MKVLVVAASRHGSTEELAAAIAGSLAEAGLAVGRAALPGPADLKGVDAVVVGSAVYYGHWLKEARGFVERNARRLNELPVWLFSSGPIGDDLRPPGDPADAAELMALTGAREHVVFAGRLEKGRLGLSERLMAKAVGAQEGDFRDWRAVREWAGQVAMELRRRSAA